MSVSIIPGPNNQLITGSAAPQYPVSYVDTASYAITASYASNGGGGGGGSSGTSGTSGTSGVSGGGGTETLFLFMGA